MSAPAHSNGSEGSDSASPAFEPYLRRWNLVADGAPFTTRTALLLPVSQHGVPAMLKCSVEEDDWRGAALMDWWDGDDAARILAHNDGALLMERATGSGSLAEMARNGRDDEACRILCATAERLHLPRNTPPPRLTRLKDWFADLEPAARRHGGLLHLAAEAARFLFAEPRGTVVLHGDLHHGNVLDFGARGWLAIDPKGLIGERGFDYANIFTNPDLDDPSRSVAIEPGCFERRLAVVAQAAGLERERLLLWILAWTGLSAAWFLADDGSLAAIDLRIAGLAAAELGR